MKKHVLLFALITTGHCIYAQSTITGNGVNPVAGETITTYLKMDSLASTGGVGPNQVWDYRTLSGGTSTPAVMISPVGTPKASSFNANLCMHNGAGASYDYYYGDNSVLKYLGTCNANGSSGNHITNPSSLYKYPLSYGNTASETINETIVDFGTSPQQTKTGMQTWIANGYGTLRMPGGTFTNVLKVQHILIDTTRANGNVLATEKTITTEWFYPGIHSPIIGSGVSIYTEASFPPAIVGETYYTDKGPLAVNELLVDRYRFSCFPNPAKDMINVKFDLDKAADVTVNVLSVNGQTVLSVGSEHVQQQKSVVRSLSLDNLTPGPYMIDLNIAGVHLYQQFLNQ